MIRSHTCGQLRAEHIGQQVTLCGWVDSYRDHGGGIFIDLRDRYGKTQIVFGPESGAESQELARSLRSEFVVSVTGTVAHRPEGTVNAKLATGEIEVRPSKLVVLNKSLTPPFQPGGKELPNEDLRLKYRYLDLRRADMQATLLLRHRIISGMRRYFDEHAFIDVETPMLGRSTPEGARDYLVPSRVHNGSFYALPQSPQLYKQILMIAGYDRYVQVARCFRDEDLRADRQPEFTQLDLEMSFVDSDDVIQLIDGLVARLAKEILGQEVKLPLPRMTYDEAMERFGHDCAGLAIRHGTGRSHRSGQRGRIPRVSRHGRRRRSRARHQRQGGRGELLAQNDRRADELHRARLRRQGAGLVQGRRGRHAGLADCQEF